MASGYRRFTEQEDRLIIRTIQKHPENISWCFCQLAKQLGRTEASINARYYQHIKPSLQTEIRDDNFKVAGSNKVNPSIKNQRRDNRGRLPMVGIPVPRKTIKDMFRKLLEVLKI